MLPKASPDSSDLLSGAIGPSDAPRARPGIVGEADRQAIDSLGGYAHQLLASAIEWTRLPDGGELHLEVAEDYATAIRGQLDATQVKRVAGTVSLAAESTRIAMRSMVRLAKKNPGMVVRLTFLTTAEVTSEHQLVHRTGGTPGLIHWREVADGADASRLRAVLLALELGDEVHRFIRDRDDEALRSDLLQRIDWRCGAADTEELEEILRERVADLCLREFDVPPVEGEQRADNVVQQVLRTCIRREERMLSHGGLRVALRRATDMGIDRRSLNNLMAAVGFPDQGLPGVRRAAGWTAEAALPIPPLIVERPAVVGPLAAAVTAHRMALVHGGTGMGKTAVARLAARGIGGSWNFLECRGATLRDAADRLRSYSARAKRDAFGVILDDLPDLRVVDETPALLTAIREILDRGEAVIATSATPPAPRAAAALGLRPGSVVSVPLLSEEELVDLVGRAGGDVEWAAPVRLASRGGHPQLANAVVSGLRTRGWPPQDSSKAGPMILQEVDAEAETARRRLADTLTDKGARELLYRVSVVAERFPRDVALAVGAVEPGVALPGEAFDVLIGPWVDQVAPDRFRVSPLLHGAGSAVLPPATVRGVHGCVADSLITTTGLQADQADNIFFHGLEARAEHPLLALASAVIRSDEADLWLLRPFAPRLTGADTARSIAPWSPALAVQLRLAQALVLSSRGVNQRAAKVIRALLAEARHLPTRSRARFEAVALGKLLFRSGLSRHMPEWPEMLGRLVEVAQDIGFQAPPFPDGADFDDLPAVLLAFSLSGLRSVASLADAFDRLEAVPPPVRARMLAPDRLATAPLIVALGPWLKERKGENADGPAAAGTYARLARLAASWSERAWAVAFAAASADILAELGDTSGALDSLRTAQEMLGQDRWLLRAEQKVRSRLEQDESVVEIVERLGGAFADLPIESAHIRRDGAVSASRLSRHDLAARWLEESATAASGVDLPMMQAMAVGLRADAAAETWRSGGRRAALERMVAVLDDLARIDPDASLQSGFAHRIIRHSLLWFARDAGVERMEVSGLPPALPPGACSHPEPNPAITELPLTPISLARSFLLLISAQAELSSTMPGPAGRQAAFSMLPMELADRGVPLFSAVAAADPEAFALTLRPAIDAALAGREILKGDEQASQRRARDPGTSLTDPDGLSFAASAILTFRVVAGATGKPEAAARLRTSLAAGSDQGLAAALDIVFPLGPLPRIGLRNPEYCAGLVGRSDLDADELLECCVRLLQFFQRTGFRGLAEGPLARWAKREWLHFARNRRFALVRPRLAAPAIEAAAAAAGEDFQGLAVLTQAAASGVEMSLPQEVHAWLRELSGAKPTS